LRVILVPITKEVVVVVAIDASTGGEPITLSSVVINPSGNALGFRELRNPHVTHAGLPATDGRKPNVINILGNSSIV
jgi:hypothetical protein